VKGKVVLDGRRGLYGLDLKSGADVGQGARAEGKRLWVVCLPPLVFGTKVEGAGVLEVGGKDDGLVAGLTGKLHTQVPRIERDEGELEVLGCNVLSVEVVEALDGVSERTCAADLVPGEGS
jgi:hypothetical protein